MDSVFNALKDAGTQALHNVGVVARDIPTFVIAVLIVLFAAWIAQAIGSLMLRADRISPHLDPSLKLLIRQLIVAGIIIFGVTVAFGILGVSIATIIASFGVAGLIVGFALKDILENFVAGILILWRRPFEISDQIQIGTNAGTVREINFRSTSLRTADGIEVLIPNSLIFNQPIQNFTEGGSRRSTIVATVPTGTDLALATSLLKQAVESVDGVLAAPAPEVLLLGSTASDYQLHVRYWTSPTIQITGQIESAARIEILRVLAGPELQGEADEPTEAAPGT